MTTVYERQKKDPKTGQFVKLPDGRRNKVYIDDFELQIINVRRKAIYNITKFCKDKKISLLALNKMLEHFDLKEKETQQALQETNLTDIPKEAKIHVQTCFHMMKSLFFNPYNVALIEEKDLSKNKKEYLKNDPVTGRFTKLEQPRIITKYLNDWEIGFIKSWREAEQSGVKYGFSKDREDLLRYIGHFKIRKEELINDIPLTCNLPDIPQDLLLFIEDCFSMMECLFQPPLD